MPSRTQPSESKQGLVISLVFFVMLSIILAVTTYFGYSGQQAYLDKEKEATKDKDTMKKEKDALAVEAAVYRAAIGLPAAKVDAEAIGAAKGKPELEALVRSLKGVKWDPKTEDKPGQSYADLVEANAKEITNLQAKLAQSNGTVTSTQADLEQEKKDHQKDKADLQQDIVKAQTALKDLVEKHSTAFDDQTKMLQQRAAELLKAKKSSKDAKDDYETELAKKDKTIKEQKIKLAKDEEQIKPVELLNYDEPKGKVVRVERSGSFAYINLGSADHVKPQLTFSVFGAGSYKADKAPKGSLEVVTVVEPHLSMARITAVKESGRDPLLTGDLLYNPAWSPSLRQHVAVAGLVDLSGEAKDSMADSIRNLTEFIKNLEKQNIVVDAYVNLKDGTTRGEITLKTNYLVLGDQAEFSQNSPLTKGEPGNDRKNEINKRRSEMQDDATHKGITIVPVRRFAALIGYRMPTTARDEYGGTSSSNVPADELKERKESEKDEADKVPAKKDTGAKGKGKGKPAKEKEPDEDPDK